MNLNRIRYTLIVDEVQFSYIKTQIQNSRQMYLDAYRFIKQRKLNEREVKAEVWAWLTHYKEQYVTHMAKEELYAMWYLLQKTKGNKPSFYKCTGSRQWIWRRFPLASCLPTPAPCKEKDIVFMKLWYKKKEAFLEIKYRSFTHMA